MEVCKTDMQKIIKYLDDAAIMYDNHPGQRNVCRAWVIRQLIKKLNKKYLNIKLKFKIPLIFKCILTGYLRFQIL